MFGWSVYGEITTKVGGAAMSADGGFPRVTVYSTTWCGDCRRSKRLLERHGVPFEEINIEHSPEAAREVMRLARGHRSVPTIVIEDGPVLVEPSDRQLAQALGLPL
jgi:glutaredoxin